MKDPKYRDLMGDIYHLAESMECPPASGTDESAEWWKSAAQKLQEINGKYAEEPYFKLALDLCIAIYKWAEREIPAAKKE